MALFLTIFLVVIPFIELMVVIAVSHVIGIAVTLLLLILSSAAGAWVVKHEGIAAIRRVRTAWREGRAPTDEVADGALVVLAGLLLLLPGFVTSVLGALLAVRPVRGVVRGRLTSMFHLRVARRFPTATDRTQRTQRTQRSDTTGPRPYRRPDEPEPTSTQDVPWRTRVRSPGARSDGVIDVEGEEIAFPYGTEGELGPSDS